MGERAGQGRKVLGGFIDDVVNGERILVERPSKEFAYSTLRLGVSFSQNVSIVHRQRNQVVIEGRHHAKAEETSLMKALPIKATLTVEGPVLESAPGPASRF